MQGPVICKIDKTGNSTAVFFSNNGEDWVSPAEFFDLDFASDYVIKIDSKEILSFNKTVTESE